MTRLPKPRTFTSNEEVVMYLSEQIMSSGKTYKQIATDVGVSQSTIANIASGKTSWPRPATFFGLIRYFGIKMEFSI